jgi:hypothetical protein
MPLPSAADPRLLDHHLVVVVIDLILEELGHGPGDAFATDSRAEDIVTQGVPQGQQRQVPVCIVPSQALLIIAQDQLSHIPKNIYLF